MSDTIDWFEFALPRYFEGDLDRIESARFEALLDKRADCQERFDRAWEARVTAHGLECLPPSMPEFEDCFSIDTLEAFVAGRLSGGDRQVVEAHLGCLLCREQVEALREHGAAPKKTRAVVRWSRSIGVIAAAAAVIFAFVLAPGDRQSTPTWTSRGPEDADTGFRATFLAGTRALQSGDTITTRARIQVRLDSVRLDDQNLLAFAVDEAGQVFWYYPAWSDASTDPLAVAIDRREANGGLPVEAIEHDLRSGSLRLTVLLSRDRLSVRTVEKMISERPITPTTSTKSWSFTSEALEYSIIVHVRDAR